MLILYYYLIFYFYIVNTYYYIFTVYSFGIHSKMLFSIEGRKCGRKCKINCDNLFMSNQFSINVEFRGTGFSQEKTA